MIALSTSAAAVLLAAGVLWLQQKKTVAEEAEETCLGPDLLGQDVLSAFIALGVPGAINVSQLPAAALLHWTPRSLAEKAPILKDVWVKNRSATEISTRFTYCVPSRTLGPLLREKLISHEVMQIGTEEMLKACIQDTKKRYFYSGLAEGADGLVHSDAKKLVESFLRAVEGVRSKATTPPASPASTSEARANVWISCPFTGASTHYDMGYNIVLQLFGTKTFELLPPEAFVELNIPPTGHPFARQVMKEGRHNFSRFHLKRGDALYVPPLWAHRTTTGEGAEQEVSISLNIFIGSAAEDVAEQLNALALPFEASWPSNTMQFAVALYLKAFLDEAQVDARYLAARWALVELKEELPANCTAVIPQSESILKRGRDAALLLQALPRKHRAPIALDYADDVLLGVLEAKVIHSVIRECLISSLDKTERTSGEMHGVSRIGSHVGVDAFKQAYQNQRERERGQNFEFCSFSAAPL